MSNAGWIFGALCLIVCMAVVFVDRRKTRKVMNTLDEMLSSATDGSFKESSFDETMLSALETRFAHYLSASVISARNVAQEKDRIKSLIADISHQTKTPIANLMLYSELLQEEELSPEAEEYASTLHGQAEKLRFLIDTLVKLSRLENGIIALHPENNVIEPVLRQVQHEFELKAAEKGLSLNVASSDAEACFDSKWTAEALCNLVDNAIKYTEKGGVTISVTPYELFLRVDVSDTGSGISEEEQARIFSRFYRGDTNARQEGVGIGLYLAREILHTEGGYIKVSSEVGKGSVFSVFLPVQAGENHTAQ